MLTKSNQTFNSVVQYLTNNSLCAPDDFVLPAAMQANNKSSFCHDNKRKDKSLSVLSSGSSARQECNWCKSKCFSFVGHLSRDCNKLKQFKENKNANKQSAKAANAASPSPAAAPASAASAVASPPLSSVPASSLSSAQSANQVCPSTPKIC